MKGCLIAISGDLIYEHAASVANLSLRTICHPRTFGCGQLTWKQLQKLRCVRYLLLEGACLRCEPTLLRLRWRIAHGMMAGARTRKGKVKSWCPIIVGPAVPIDAHNCTIAGYGTVQWYMGGACKIRVRSKLLVLRCQFQDSDFEPATISYE